MIVMRCQYFPVSAAASANIFLIQLTAIDW